MGTKRGAGRTARKTTRRMQGGGLGQSYGFTGTPIVGGVDTGPSWDVQSSCMAVQRPGMAPMPTTGLGLPGVSLGGGRRSQRGGRYGFDLSQQVAPATPFLGGIPPVMKIPCESASTTANPLNPRMTGGAEAAAYNVITPPPATMQDQLNQNKLEKLQATALRKVNTIR